MSLKLESVEKQGREKPGLYGKGQRVG